ncbi:MAG TPA: AMP-binding protein [Chthonomonadaceae bacterium]|nr:AMP-binding protein [Chthonomonadaceae bacterium]
MLTQMLWQTMQANPAKTAVVQGNRRLDYAALYTLAARCSGGLHRLGLEAGGCVAVVLPNCPEFLISLFACARLHAILLPLNPQYTREELQRFLMDARARVILTDAPRVERCLQIAASIGQDIRVIAVGERVARAMGFDELAQHPAPVPLEDAYCGPALYLYTSGSTDTYKRVCCTQENLWYEAANFVDTLGLTPEDNILCTIPFYHSYGLGNCLLDAVYAGSTLVLPETVVREDLLAETPFAARCRRVFELIREEAIRVYPGVPYQFTVLADFPEGGRAEVAGLKWCISSGDVLPRQTYERFLARYGLPIRSLYGSTEAGSICMDISPNATIQFGSLGLPLKNVAIRIGDEAGRELPESETGHIWVKSPVLPPTGYDNRPELNAQVFCDGYYNTGDIGKREANGHLVMTGRKQTFVDVGGYKVALNEVEEALQSHPLVREAAALDVAIPNMGRLIKAVVATTEPCTEAGILAYCRERLAPFKVPRLIEFRAELPRSPLGKILKSELGEVTALPQFPASPDGDPSPSMIHHLLAAPVARRQALLEEFIQQQVALVLGDPTRTIPRNQGFFDLGLGSLTSIELGARLQQALECRLPATLAVDYPTVDALVQYLIHAVLPIDFHGASARQQADPAEVALEGLTRDDLAALLSEELRVSTDSNRDAFHEVETSF